MITSEVFKEGRRGRTRGSYLLKKQRGWGGWVDRRWPLLFHQGEAGLFRKKRNTFGISGLILRRFGEGRVSFGSTNPSVRHTLSPFQFLTYQDSGQPRTQGLSSIRPLSRYRDGKNRDPGNQVGFSLLCQFKERFLSVQVTCHFSFQSRSLSLLSNSMQTNEFQERQQKHCVLWPKCLLHRRRFETDFTSIETTVYESRVHCLSSSKPILITA